MRIKAEPRHTNRPISASDPLENFEIECLQWLKTARIESHQLHPHHT